MPLNRLIDSGQRIVPPPDVQHTTLGIDVRGRFVCNTWDEATSGGAEQFDAVVIGAGWLFRRQDFPLRAGERPEGPGP